MAATKETPPARKWELKVLVESLRKKEAEDPDSLSNEELALLEILQLSSPKTLEKERKYLVSYFKKCFIHDNLEKALADAVDRLANTRKARPTAAQIKSVTDAGLIFASTAELDFLQRVLHQHRSDAVAASRGTPSAGE
jgi:hypothetical protein